MPKVIHYLFLVPLGSLLGLILAFLITKATVGNVKDYYVPIYTLLLLAILLVPLCGTLGGYFARKFNEALTQQSIPMAENLSRPIKRLTIGIIFDRDLPEVETVWDTDCKCLAHEISTLDEICTSLQVPLLSYFLVANSKFSEIEADTEEVENQDIDDRSSDADLFRESSDLCVSVNALLLQLSNTENPRAFPPELLACLNRELQQLHAAARIAIAAGAKCKLFMF
jgi:hypothetical protein